MQVAMRDRSWKWLGADGPGGETNGTMNRPLSHAWPTFRVLRTFDPWEELEAPHPKIVLELWSACI